MSIQSEISPHDQLLKKLWKSAGGAQFLTRSMTADPFLVPLVRGLTDEEFTFVDTIMTSSSIEDSHPDTKTSLHPVRRFFAAFVDVVSKSLPKRRELAWPEGWAERHIEQSIRGADAGAFAVLQDAVTAERKARTSE